MSDHDKHNLLLMAVEHLKQHYQSAQNPCLALLISRQYRLLADATLTKDQQQYYARHADIWLSRYISHSGPVIPKKYRMTLSSFLNLTHYAPRKVLIHA